MSTHEIVRAFKSALYKARICDYFEHRQAAFKLFSIRIRKFFSKIGNQKHGKSENENRAGSGNMPLSF